jgi:hypothetical protein
MTIATKCRWARPAVIIATLCTAVSATSLAQSAPSPDQHLASIKDSQRQTADYLNGLAAAVRSEERDNAWAAQQESTLRDSFAAERGLPQGALRSVECRSSKCSLELYLSAEGSPAVTVKQQAAIGHWISVSQPCAYTMTNPAAQPIRIFLNCKR